MLSFILDKHTIFKSPSNPPPFPLPNLKLDLERVKILHSCFKCNFLQEGVREGEILAHLAPLFPVFKVKNSLKM